jgi:hypothetical protein
MSLFWRKYDMRKRALEKRYSGEVYREVRKQYNSFLTAINTHGYDYAKAHLNEIIPIDGIAEVIKKIYRAGAWIESKYVFEYLSKDKPLQLKRLRKPEPPSFGVGFDEIANVVDDYFQIYLLNKAALPISETTKRQIRERLIAEVDAGVPLDEAIRNFKQYALTSGDHPHSVVSRIRALTIIETETLKAMNFGGFIGAYMTGVDLDKVWVTCEDERVRGVRGGAQFPHTSLDRRVTDFFGSFYNGEPIRFPGDPEASVGNTIKCRCTMFFKKKERAQPKATRTITSFLSDFFIGFTIGNSIGNFFSSLIEDNG